MTGIIPRSKAKGTDICLAGKHHYIIRSDLGCYMKTTDVKEGLNISIWSLHPACQNGDHYLGGDEGIFFIIKGNSFRRVTDLTRDTNAKVYSLHPNCRGGDHYALTKNYYYIFFQEKGTYRRTTDMHLDTNGLEYKLHPNCRNGLYYWDCYFIKPASEWGYEFCGCRDFRKDEFFGVYSVHPDVLTFLPGGLSVTKGPAFGRWENIKTITNDSNTPVTWQKKITKKVGYNKEKMTEITHNWKIATSASAESGDLASSIAKAQFSFSIEYGGSHVSTDKESWEEATEEEEQLSVDLKPNESVYLWQYRLGIGKEPVLFCRDLKIDDVPNPPTEVPLPSAKP
ncbi:uncharacterized protein [Pseudorasbora parva]|uniref:uncharacterized protein n=1 Tax=Pseudorasbora parva TaxID=51549 RepID=UPI00351E0A02